MNYSIGIIDDESRIANENKLILEASDEDLRVEVYDGCLTNNETLEWILDNGIECAIIDYTMHAVAIENGIELTYYIDNVLQGFPCVILTAFKGDASESGLKLLPNIKIYEKDTLERDDKVAKEFIKTIKILIDSFKNRMNLNEKRYATLLEEYKNNYLPEEHLKELTALDKILKAYNYIDDVTLKARKNDVEEMLSEMLDNIRKLNKH